MDEESDDRVSYTKLYDAKFQGHTAQNKNNVQCRRHERLIKGSPVRKEARAGSGWFGELLVADAEELENHLEPRRAIHKEQSVKKFLCSLPDSFPSAEGKSAIPLPFTLIFMNQGETDASNIRMQKNLLNISKIWRE